MAKSRATRVLGVALNRLIAEGEDYVKASGDKDVRDAGLIGAAQRVEHYEIAGYGTARTLATRLGESEAADKLQTTLGMWINTRRGLILKSNPDIANRRRAEL